MIFNLSEHQTIANQFIAEIRDKTVQQDRMRFRRNLERIGEVLAYEISKELDYKEVEIETPLGASKEHLPSEDVVLTPILRAGLPLHKGLLNYFDKADNAFISAFRVEHKSGEMEIELQYISAPNVDGKVVIICDAMIATGSSIVISLKELLKYGQPKKIYVATAIASTSGLEYVQRRFPDAMIWAGAIDEELTARSYIVPGLGDAGDLAFGEKETDLE